MSDYQPQLYTYEEWCALTDEQRTQRLAELTQAVEELRREHHARQQLLDSLTVERFSHDHG
jgi:hypothetical protein